MYPVDWTSSTRGFDDALYAVDHEPFVGISNSQRKPPPEPVLPPELDVPPPPDPPELVAGPASPRGGETV
ncbi:MAG TPA: hypothetical protein VIF15_04135 [Polyangiaceae bacterium]